MVTHGQAISLVPTTETEHSEVTVTHEMLNPGPFRVWWGAIRPATLSLSVVPVIVAGALAQAQGVFHPLATMTAALGAILIQIGTNLVNDYGDFVRGADRSDRLGPPRATAKGWLTPRQVLTGAILAYAGVAIAGIYLVILGGWPILLIGVLGVLSGIAYTCGPAPLAYVGAGDVFVFVFFGLVSVGGAYWVQARAITAEVLLAGAALGALSTCVLVVNNIRDHRSDALSHKRTLVVRFGVTAARIQYTVLVLFALLTPALLWLTQLGSSGWFLTLLSFPLALHLVLRIWREEGGRLNPLLGQTAALTLSYGLLLSVGLVLS